MRAQGHIGQLFKKNNVITAQHIPLIFHIANGFDLDQHQATNTIIPMNLLAY